MAENYLSSTLITNEERQFLEGARNENDFIDRISQLDSGLELALNTNKGLKELEKTGLLEGGKPKINEIKEIIGVIYQTDYEKLNDRYKAYDKNIHEAFYKGSVEIYRNANGIFKGRVAPTFKKGKDRVSDDFKSAGAIEEGSIISGIIKLYKKLFK